MKIGVIGNGYVGTTIAIGLASKNHKVIGFDIDEEKINSLQQSKLPIYEPGLDELLKKVISKNLIEFTTDFSKVNECDVVFLALPTPQDDQGRADLSYLFDAIKTIKPYLNEKTILVTKSTIPPGTSKKIKEIVKVNVAFNPEFLREGSALKDFLEPDRIVIGVDNAYTKKILEKVYDSFAATKLFTNLETAELIKYASNSFLAMSISFINSLSRLAEKVGADITQVSQGMKLDKRIGKYAFLSAGLGFGGSCFPKDVSALYSLAKDYNLDLTLLKDTLEENDNQVQYFANKIISYYDSKSIVPKLAILGLSFKGNTDDIRYSRAIELIKRLKQKQYYINAYDPKAIPNVQQKYPDLIDTFKPIYEIFRDVDGIVITTDWKEFKELDFDKIKSLVNLPIIFDGRNLLKPIEGFEYFKV